MKNYLVLFVCLLAFPTVVNAQKVAPPSDAYQLGARTVRVPAPEGFVEIGSTFSHIAERFRATEDPKNEGLAVHVPTSFVPKLKISEAIDLDFYTKVSVNRQVKGMDVTPELYSAVVANLEKEFGSLIDPKGTVMKGVGANSTKGLSEVYGQPTKVNIDGVTNLGFFEKSSTVFSGMLLVNVQVGARRNSTLGTFSVLYVNQRIVFAYAFKMAPSETDAAMIADFTKKWTAKIMAANK